VSESVSITDIQRMKQDGTKSVCIVAWDREIARLADRAGADIISIGDSVGVNLWGHESPLEITMDEVLTVAKAVRRGVQRALLSCDLPFGPLQQGTAAAVDAAIRLVKEARVDVVKLDGAADFPEAVEAITRAGIPVFSQFGLTPQSALRAGVGYAEMAAAGAEMTVDRTDLLVKQARTLEQAGSVFLNLTNSGPVVGPAVVEAVSIPVLGGFGGGPWLDGRIRMATAAIGYSADSIDTPPGGYANVAQVVLDALSEYAEDVRAGRQIKGGRGR